MCTQKKWQKKLFILPLCLLLFTACNQNEPPKNNEPSDANVEGGDSPAPALVSFTGTLDTLYVDTAAFNDLPNGRKVMFSFVYLSQDTLTLHGWTSTNSCNSNDSINKKPDIQLSVWRKGTIPIKPTLYFGNVFINNQDIKNIKDKYEATVPKSKYVVFAPRVEYGHILYRIYVTNDPTKPLTGGAVTFNLEDTGYDANPSPPRGN